MRAYRFMMIKHYRICLSTGTRACCHLLAHKPKRRTIQKEVIKQKQRRQEQYQKDKTEEDDEDREKDKVLVLHGTKQQLGTAFASGIVVDDEETKSSGCMEEVDGRSKTECKSSN